MLAHDSWVAIGQVVNMKMFPLLGAFCTLSASGIAQNFVDGSITAYVHPNWVLQSCYYVPATQDPIGLIKVDGSLVNTFATSNGDHCEANGTSRDTVAGGMRLTQTATAMGVHFCDWVYVPTPEEPLGEVEIGQQAQIDGSVTLTNQQCAGAGLGWAEATSNVTVPSLAVLTDSAAQTVLGGLGDVSGAYAGITGYSANVQLGNGTFTDTDFAYDDNVVCVNYLFVQHRSRSFVRVSSLRSSGSPGTAQAVADMVGDCTTGALLWVCPL